MVSTLSFLIDECLTPDLKEAAERFGHFAFHARDLGLLSAPDPAVVRAALTDDRIAWETDAQAHGMFAIFPINISQKFNLHAIMMQDIVEEIDVVVGVKLLNLVFCCRPRYIAVHGMVHAI